MKKKLIFVGGTARSGSTLLDLILANDPKAMSLGEIHALFRPTRKHHFEEIKNKKEDPIWSKIIIEGRKKMFQNLSYYFPDIQIFIDSSKDPYWFQYQEKINNNNFIVKHVLIYKSLEELALSFIKRGKKFTWLRTYIHYHKKYFSIIKHFKTIAYRDLIEDDEALMLLCNWLDINYSKRRKNYWEKEYQTFFGSNSVKSSNSIKEQSQLVNFQRKELHYEEPDDASISFVTERLQNSKEAQLIGNLLYENSIIVNNQSISAIPNSLCYTRFHLYSFNIKYKSIRFFRYFKPVDFFKSNI